VAEAHGARFSQSYAAWVMSKVENLIIERYSAMGIMSVMPVLAQEIVTSSPDLIVTGTNPVVIAFKGQPAQYRLSRLCCIR